MSTFGAAVGSGVASLIAAAATGTQIGVVNARVEGLAGASAGLVATFAGTLPLGYAFAAGMVAAFNPCGFALLPAYLALYVGERDPAPVTATRLRQLSRSIQVSAIVTVAFVLLFASVGLILNVTAGALVRHMAWAGLAVGVGMLVVGGSQIAGRTPYVRWGEALAARFGPAAGRADLRGFFAFGLVYGLGSLSCTLPVFLAVVGTAWTLDGPLGATVNYASYAAGMGVVIGVLTIAAGLLRATVLTHMRAVVRTVHVASAVLVLAAGAYIIYYWLTIGGLLRVVVTQ
ncbi:MAG: cytochrome c biogenesis protein CcdA [Chloroflexi bacterium]|nr:cytochrome c biogenesis protein CcdA [Chloroflexota bacterium]